MRWHRTLILLAALAAIISYASSQNDSGMGRYTPLIKVNASERQMDENTTAQQTTTTSTTSTLSTSTSSITTTSGEGQPSESDTLSREAIAEIARNESREALENTSVGRPCGNTDKICSVEYDLAADGRPDCCNGETNPMCLKCLKYCMGKCGSKGVSVNTCFFEEGAGATCECSDSAPTCYTLEVTTTIPPEEGPSSTVTTGSYIFILASVLLTGAGAIIFLRRTK